MKISDIWRAIPIATRLVGVALTAFVLFTAPSDASSQDAAPVTDVQPPDVPCPPGSLPAPPPIRSSVDVLDMPCAPIGEPVIDSTPPEPEPLQGHFADFADEALTHDAGDMSATSDPAPQGVPESGTEYVNETLPTTYSSTFSTYMEVYPDYVPEEFATYADGVYITAMNNTQHGVEFLARYRPGDSGGLFQVYDWSCLPAYQCDNGYPNVPGQDGFVADWDMHEMLEDNTGHFVNYVYYRNSSWIV